LLTSRARAVGLLWVLIHPPRLCFIRPVFNIYQSLRVCAVTLADSSKQRTPTSKEMSQQPFRPYQMHTFQCDRALKQTIVAAAPPTLVRGLNAQLNPQLAMQQQQQQSLNRSASHQSLGGSGNRFPSISASSRPGTAADADAEVSAITSHDADSSFFGSNGGINTTLDLTANGQQQQQSAFRSVSNARPPIHASSSSSSSSSAFLQAIDTSHSTLAPAAPSDGVPAHLRSVLSAMAPSMRLRAAHPPSPSATSAASMSLSSLSSSSSSASALLTSTLYPMAGRAPSPAAQVCVFCPRFFARHHAFA
jgi:hypothetical protein